MAKIVVTTLVFLQWIWVVLGETLCVRNCTCTSNGYQSPPIWPEAIAATAGLVAPAVVLGIGYGIKKLVSSPSTGSFDVKPTYPRKQSLMKDFNRKGSLESSDSSASGSRYDLQKRRQSVLTVFDSEDDFGNDLNRRDSSGSWFTGEEPSWQPSSRGAPMTRPAFLGTGTNNAAINTWLN